jgi:hypothetical protein
MLAPQRAYWHFDCSHMHDELAARQASDVLGWLQGLKRQP